MNTTKEIRQRPSATRRPDAKSLSRLYIYIIGIVALCLGACDDYDTWTASPTKMLHLERDTVSFDTLITSHSSSTKTLWVWNNNEAGLRIRSIALKEGADSHFRVNADGEFLSGGWGEDFEVRRKDSLCVRIEVMLPELDVDEPQHYTDELVFTLESGVQQTVFLEAAGQDVYTLQALRVEKDTTLCAGRPYLIYDSLVVAPGATLTLEPGVVMLFHDSVPLNIHGKLIAEGTLEKPITLRGDRLDRMFDNLPYDNTPGRWGGVHIFGESSGNRLLQCDIHGGDFGIRCDSATVFDEGVRTLYMKDCVVHYVKGDGLSSTCCNLMVIGTQISNTLGRTVSLLGGQNTFVHCTIAQFYPLSYNRGDALYLSDHEGEGDEALYYPLHRAWFLNCVITGYAEDVIMGSIYDTEETPGNYLFSHCLLRTVKSDDEQRFVSIVYDTKEEDGKAEKTDEEERLLAEKNFHFDLDNMLYPFVPDSLSRIRSLADPEVTRRYSPTDRLGNSRMADDAPDAGAYEFVARKTEE